MTYNPTRTWAIPDTEITIPNDNGHFLYLKVPTAEGATDAQILIDENHIDPMRDDGYIIYKQGYIQPKRNGKRTASMLWGNVAQSEYAPIDHDHEIGNQVLLFENNLI